MPAIDDLKQKTDDQLQQQLGDAAGHVGEDQVGQVVVGAAQPAGQHPQQLLGDFGTISDPCP